jgi:hypothetical protein
MQSILDKVPHEKKNCFSVIISLFLSHNKLYLNDLIYCFNINFCIFLFLTMSKKICLLAFMFFVSTKTYQIVLLYQSDSIMLYVDPIHYYYSYTCIFLSSTFIPIILDLHLYMLVLYNNSLAIVHCSCPIIFLFYHVAMVGGDGGGERTLL